MMLNWTGLKDDSRKRVTSSIEGECPSGGAPPNFSRDTLISHPKTMFAGEKPIDS